MVGWWTCTRFSLSMCSSVVLPALSSPRNRILALLWYRPARKGLDRAGGRGVRYSERAAGRSSITNCPPIDRSIDRSTSCSRQRQPALRTPPQARCGDTRGFYLIPPTHQPHLLTERGQHIVDPIQEEHIAAAAAAAFANKIARPAACCLLRPLSSVRLPSLCWVSLCVCVRVKQGVVSLKREQHSIMVLVLVCTRVSIGRGGGAASSSSSSDGMCV